MSKKNGTLFSKAMFGYNKTDVNEYIRRTDEEHSSETAKLKEENLNLENKLLSAEEKIKELEALLENERVSSTAEIQRISDESQKKLDDAEKTKSEICEKLNESEARATSYLKLADSSSLRAESAEAEVTLLSAGLENARNEIDELKKAKDADDKKITELEALVGSYAAQEEINKAERRKYFFIKRPAFLRFVGKK